MSTNVLDESGFDTESDETSESGAAADLAVTIHLRAAPSSAAARRQQSVLETLRALESADDGPSVAVRRWGAQVNVPVVDGDADVDAVALYEEFRRAVDRAGGRLEPFFEQREAVGGLLSSGPPTDRVIVLPVICLVIRREGTVTGLYPCWVDGVHHSVEDGLGALAGSGDVENL